MSALIRVGFSGLLVCGLGGCGQDGASPNAAGDKRPRSRFPEQAAKLTAKELEVCAAAFRYMLSDGPADTDGVLFLSIDGKDPPRELTGLVFRPVSRAVWKGVEPREQYMPRERWCDRVTGELGSVLTVKIIKWIGEDRVKVECRSETSGLWGGGYTIYLRLVDGTWKFDGVAPGSHWIS